MRPPYIPGVTPRPPEGAFDAVKASVHPGMDAGALAASAALAEGLRLYRDGYFWECHEVLEAVWMAARDGTPEKAAVQGVIQLANAALKARMGRPRAVRRLCGMAETLLAQAGGPGALPLGLPGAAFAADLARLRRDSAE